MPDYPDGNDAKAVAAWLSKPPRPFNPHDAAAQEWVKRSLVLHRQAALDELHRRADATDDPESPVETIARWFSEQQDVAIDTAEHGNWQPLADMRRSWSKEVREQFNLRYSDRLERLTADRLQDKVKREGKPRALEGAWFDKDLAAMTAKVIQNICTRPIPDRTTVSTRSLLPQFCTTSNRGSCRSTCEEGAVASEGNRTKPRRFRPP